MKISIVTISYNQAKFLRQCIDSVLSQEGVDLEYIVVDPGSTDGSREIIESYGDRIVKVFHPDAGPADGLNKGFARATGEIFGFINSDDYFMPGSLAIVDRVFQEIGTETFITGKGFILDENGNLKKVYPSKLKLYNYVIGASNVFQQGTFFPASMFRQVGGFNPENRTCWDGELFAQFLFHGFNHYLINDYLAVFRLYPLSITGSGRFKTQCKRDKREIFYSVMNRYPNLFDHTMNKIVRFFKKMHQFAPANWRV